MTICIHRGSHQIGGSCVEVKSQGKSLILDLGVPLDLDDLSQAEFPEGFQITDNTLGLLISHYHLDHSGLLAKLSQTLPYGMGSSAWNILKAASPFLLNSKSPEPVSWEFRHEEAITIGPFMITPYLMDHSAFDAYAFLIEADDKRIFYTGDFRAHGRKAKLFELLLKKDLGRIDAIIMEGTTLGGKSSHVMKKEGELEKEFEAIMTSSKGAVLVNCSSQNIDRIVTVFRAAKRSGRKLVVDLYTAEILKATGRSSIPQSEWDDVELYIPYRQRVFIKREELFSQLKSHSSHRIFGEELIDKADDKVLLFRSSFLTDHTIAGELPVGAYIYSQWKGYLEKESYLRVKKWLEDKSIRDYYIHTSGHAGLDDLKKLVDSIQPEKVIPIHSFYPEEFEKHFGDVEFFQDGEWGEI